MSVSLRKTDEEIISYYYNESYDKVKTEYYNTNLNFVQDNLLKYYEIYNTSSYSTCEETFSLCAKDINGLSLFYENRNYKDVIKSSVINLLIGLLLIISKYFLSFMINNEYIKSILPNSMDIIIKSISTVILLIGIILLFKSMLGVWKSLMFRGILTNEEE